MLLSFNCALLHWCEENYTVPSLIKCLICEWLYGQINQKKLKKYEKEYLVLREQQAQQEDPVERYEVGVDKWRAGTCYPCSTAFVTTFAKNTSIKISSQFSKFPLCQFISKQEVLRMHTQVYLVFCFFKSPDVCCQLSISTWAGLTLMQVLDVGAAAHPISGQ